MDKFDNSCSTEKQSKIEEWEDRIAILSKKLYEQENTITNLCDRLTCGTPEECNTSDSPVSSGLIDRMNTSLAVCEDIGLKLENSVARLISIRLI